MNMGLLIIDVQNDYFEGGKMPLKNTTSTLENISTIKKIFEETNLPIFLIQHLKGENADFFAKDSFGAEIHSDIYPVNTKNHLIVKNYPNSFLQTNLQEKLTQEKVDKLVIVGMMTHMCVDSTTRAACEIGYEPILISDACTTKNLLFESKELSFTDTHFAFLSALTHFADVMDTSEFSRQFHH